MDWQIDSSFSLGQDTVVVVVVVVVGKFSFSYVWGKILIEV